MSVEQKIVHRYTPKDDFNLINEMLVMATNDCGVKIYNHYIKGGWVRDLIRGVPPVDMDIYIPSLGVGNPLLNAFIRRLESADRLRLHEEKYLSANSQYSSHTLLVQTNNGLLSLDISTERGPNDQEEFCEGNCDFTCNNLIMDATGKMSTRLPPPPKMQSMSQACWLGGCIQDAVQGRLVWMVPPKFVRKNPAIQFKMRARLEKMLAKGFVETGETLSDFQLSPLRTHQDLPEDKDATCCSICRGDYSDEPEKETIVIKCDHHFHMECIKEWMESGRPNCQQCPNCRADISL